MAGRWPLRCGRERHPVGSGSGGQVVTMHQLSEPAGARLLVAEQLMLLACSASDGRLRSPARRNEQATAVSASTMMIINAGG